VAVQIPRRERGGPLRKGGEMGALEVEGGGGERLPRRGEYQRRYIGLGGGENRRRRLRASRRSLPGPKVDPGRNQISPRLQQAAAQRNREAGQRAGAALAREKLRGFRRRRAQCNRPQVAKRELRDEQGGKVAGKLGRFAGHVHRQRRFRRSREKL